MTLLLDIPEARPTPLGRLDPRWKLTALVPAACAIALLRTALPAATALAGSLLLIALARLPWRWVAIRLAAALLVPALFCVWLPFVPQPDDVVREVGGLQFSETGMLRALTLVMKAAAIVGLMLVLLATSPLHETFKAAQCLHAPGWLVQIALMAYRYVFLLADEFARMRTALRVRGYRNRASMHSYRTIGNIAGTLLIRGHDRSERVGQAMCCRGFDGRFRSLHNFRTRGVDVVFFVIVIAASAAVLVWDLRPAW
jgi:cobalt/nickel transport system permease protein